MRTVIWENTCCADRNMGKHVLCGPWPFKAMIVGQPAIIWGAGGERASSLTAFAQPSRSEPLGDGPWKAHSVRMVVMARSVRSVGKSTRASRSAQTQRTPKRGNEGPAQHQRGRVDGPHSTSVDGTPPTTARPVFVFVMYSLRPCVPSIAHASAAPSSIFAHTCSVKMQSSHSLVRVCS